jgi:hypothetical protein
MIRKEAFRAGHKWCLSVLGLAALGVTVQASCSRATKATTPGCCEKSGAGSTEDAGADSAAPVASTPAKPPPRFRIEEGCARDFKATGELGRDIAELERLCAQGLAPILGPTEISRSSGAEPLDVPFRITGSTACLRGGAVGVAPGQVLSLENARGTVLGSAMATETTAVVPVDGTVCVREAGAYRLILKPPPAAAEARTLSVQVWQAARD